MTDHATPTAWEERLRQLARHLPYPPTPDLARGMTLRLPAARSSRRRLAWTLAVCLLLLVSLLAVPSAHAVVARFLQVGVVRLLFGAPPEPPPTATPALTPAPPSAPSPQSPPLTSLFDVEGLTTLDEARDRLGYPLRLPTYPEDIGPPDRVYLQSPQEPLVILVWLEPGNASRARFSLFIITPGANLLKKLDPQVLAEARLSDQPAYWTQGAYLLQVRRRGLVATHLVSDHALIWADGPLTYRLETSLPLAEALKIAASLR
ncbi:MAG: hypothetical protein PHS96_05875 [Anaerolineales bacterium]|nr:hypothetical protein [Anaerolineales bacterium]